jgi:hypothetical protein
MPESRARFKGVFRMIGLQGGNDQPLTVVGLTQ